MISTYIAAPLPTVLYSPPTTILAPHGNGYPSNEVRQTPDVYSGASHNDSIALTLTDIRLTRCVRQQLLVPVARRKSSVVHRGVTPNGFIIPHPPRYWLTYNRYSSDAMHTSATVTRFDDWLWRQSWNLKVWPLWACRLLACRTLWIYNSSHHYSRQSVSNCRRRNNYITVFVLLHCSSLNCR